MTCQHERGDPNCSVQFPRGYAHYVREATTPDKANYVVKDAVQVGALLVLRVEYPNCRACSYEGVKVLVVRAAPMDVVYWREIDPHFRDPDKPAPRHQAPPPLARFPANEEGWRCARRFAENYETLTAPS